LRSKPYRPTPALLMSLRPIQLRCSIRHIGKSWEVGHPAHTKPSSG